MSKESRLTGSKKVFGWQTQCQSTYTIEDKDNFSLNDLLDQHDLTFTLMEVTLNIPKNPKQTWNFTVNNGENIKVEYSNYKVEIANFNNHVTRCNLYGKFEDLNKLKGEGYFLLKLQLENVVKNNYITMDDEVIITAEGTIKGTYDHKKGLQKLLAYLEKLGFRQIFPEHYELAFNNGYVPMVAKVKSILEYKEWSDSATL